MEETYICGVRSAETEENTSDLKLPEGIPPLHSLYLYLSDSCNLRCRHCWITPTYVNGKPSSGEVINPDLLLNIVREAKTLGLKNAKFTGGEPMLHPNFRKIAKTLTDEGLNLIMETNGTLIDSEIARFLKNETSISFISISLDSADEKTHDAFRGSIGAYRDALDGLKHLTESGYKNVQLIMSPHRGNVDGVKALAELAADRGAASVKLNPVTNNGRGAAMHTNDETLHFDEVMDLYNYVRGELKSEVKIPVILNVPLSVRPLSEITSPRGFNGDCGIDHIIGILGSGDIALCGIGRTMPKFVYGNIANDSICDIWINHPSVNKLRYDLNDFKNYPDLCRSCIFIKRCRTGCVVQNYSDYGKLIWPNNICLEAQELGLFKESRKRTVHGKGA